MISKTKSGWKEFPSYLRGYNRSLPLYQKILLQQSAESFLKKVKKRIKEQPSDVPPLSAFTIAKKRKQGSDTRMWVETGFWLKNLKITQVKKGVVFAGASKNKTHKPSGKTMAEIGNIFEYGSPVDKIPARPVFRPVMEQFKKSWRRKIAYSGAAFFASAGDSKEV